MVGDEREGLVAAQTGWTPVGLVAGLEPGTSAGTRLNGREIVVWRDSAGAPHVWEDRCPHRGMRLSFGFVRGDRIACLYHGWQFDAAGQCRYIPAHPGLDVPETIRVERYTCAERLGVIWACAEAHDVGDGPPGQNLATTAVRSITIQASEAEVIAALVAEANSIVAPGDGGRSGALVRLHVGEDDLVVALQNLAPDETCLHVLIVGEGDRAARRPHISAWAEAVRRRAEAGATTPGAAR